MMSSTTGAADVARLEHYLTHNPAAHQELTASYQHGELSRLGPLDPPQSGSE
jgi:hypothetical protein